MQKQKPYFDLGCALRVRKVLPLNKLPFCLKASVLLLQFPSVDVAVQRILYQRILGSLSRLSVLITPAYALLFASTLEHVARGTCICMCACVRVLVRVSGHACEGSTWLFRATHRHNSPLEIPHFAFGFCWRMYWRHYFKSSRRHLEMLQVTTKQTLAARCEMITKAFHTFFYATAVI